MNIDEAIEMLIEREEDRGRDTAYLRGLLAEYKDEAEAFAKWVEGQKIPLATSEQPPKNDPI